MVNGKKKLDKAFELKKINIHKGASYARVLLKCKDATWGDAPDDSSYEYCLTDSGGI